MVECTLHMHVSDCDFPEFQDEIPFKEGENVKPEKFQFLEKVKNRNFVYKILISVKNPKFIIWISDDKMDFSVGIISQNLASTSNSETVEIYTFFEASSFGCRKTIFDATKVTYSTYSCNINGMSREMMKMDGRDNVECQN